jgi:hypothetical protein
VAVDALPRSVGVALHDAATAVKAGCTQCVEL